MTSNAEIKSARSIWIVFDQDGNDVFCSSSLQGAKDHVQSMIEEFPEEGPFTIYEFISTHEAVTR